MFMLILAASFLLVMVLGQGGHYPDPTHLDEEELLDEEREEEEERGKKRGMGRLGRVMNIIGRVWQRMVSMEDSVITIT